MSKVEEFLNHLELLIGLGHIFGRVEMFENLVDNGYYFHVEISDLLVNIYPRRDKDGSLFWEIEAWKEKMGGNPILRRIAKNDNDLVGIRKALEVFTI